jgi:hypothetical protein
MVLVGYVLLSYICFFLSVKTFLLGLRYRGMIQ